MVGLRGPQPQVSESTATQPRSPQSLAHAVRREAAPPQQSKLVSLDPPCARRAPPVATPQELPHATAVLRSMAPNRALSPQLARYFSIDALAVGR